MQSWHVYTRPTDGNGQTVRPDARGGKVFGPYLAKIPVNPLTGKSGVCDASDLVASAGWAVELRHGKPLFMAVVPDVANPAIEKLIRCHTAVPCPDARLAQPETAEGIFLANTFMQDSAKGATASLELTVARNAIMAYALDHEGGPPTWRQMADWKVLTDPDDRADRTPYLPSPPENPFMGSSTRLVRANSADATSGWTYDEEANDIRLVIPAIGKIPAGLAEQNVERVKK